MPSRRTPLTRHALLATKAELTRATRGEEILERRLEGLVVLMRSLLERWQSGEEALEAAFEEAQRRQVVALEREGVIALEGAAMAREDHAEILFLSRKLEGLPLPLLLSRGVTKGLDERGYGLLGTSAAIDETAAVHETVLELVVRQVELELTLHILVSEIQRLHVRVNALRHRVVPGLEARVATIEFHLAEREREERLRQRFFKRRRRGNGRRARWRGRRHGRR